MPPRFQNRGAALADTGALRTDRWTDRQADRIAISILRVSVLTRDKNRLSLFFRSVALTKSKIVEFRQNMLVNACNYFFV